MNSLTAHLPDDDSIRPLLASLKNLPVPVSVRVCEQAADFLHQADFLRRALHVQAQLTGKHALAAPEQQDALDADVNDVVPSDVANQLGTLFSAASIFTPPVLDVVAQAVKCRSESVRKWFEQRNRSTGQTCKRLAKKRSGTGNHRGALFRSTKADVTVNSSGSNEVQLAPKTAVESSLSLMQLLDQSDPSRPRIRDQASARAFACVTQCPSVLLQTLLLRSIEHTRQMQLMPLSKSEVYTTLAQWLQDAVHANNEEIMRLCLVALHRIPFTEVHVLTMTTHHMYAESAPAKAQQRPDHSNPTTAEYIERLRAPEHCIRVQCAAVQLLEKWERDMERTDKVVLQDGPAPTQANKHKKNSTKRPDQASPMNVFPNDRRMKATEAVALPMNGKEVEQFKVSSAQKSSAAQRRKAADAGPLSVADIKKRKEAEQLRREMASKKQRMAAGAGAARPPGPGMAASTSGAPGAPSCTGAAAMPVGPGRQERVGPAAQSSVGRASPAAGSGAGSEASGVCRDQLNKENAHAQDSAGRLQQQLATGVGGVSAKKSSSAAGERVGDSAGHAGGGGAAQVPRARPGAAADKRASPGGKGDTAPSSIGAVRAGSEQKGGLEQLQALAKTGKAKKRRKLICWEAEELLVEDASKMLQKANANPGQCHPEVFKELNTIIKRGERVKSMRAKLKDQPSREALDALLPTIKWKPPRTHTLSQELIKVRSSWAADSVETAEQRERAYLKPAAPVSTALSEAAEADGIAEAAGSEAPEPEACQFWQDIPEGTKPQSAWWQFKGRVHLLPLAHAWEAGIRCMPAPTGIPLVGLSDPQLKAARKVVLEAKEEARQEQQQPAPLPPVPAAAPAGSGLPGPPAMQGFPSPSNHGMYVGQAAPAAQYMQQAYQQHQHLYGVPNAAYMHATHDAAQQPGVVVNQQHGPMVHVHAHVHTQTMQPAFQQPLPYNHQQPQPAYAQQQQHAFQQHAFQPQQSAFPQHAVHGFPQQPVFPQQPAMQQQPTMQPLPAHAYSNPGHQATHYQPINSWQ